MRPTSGPGGTPRASTSRPAQQRLRRALAPRRARARAPGTTPWPRARSRPGAAQAVGPGHAVEQRGLALGGQAADGAVAHPLAVVVELPRLQVVAHQAPAPARARRSPAGCARSSGRAAPWVGGSPASSWPRERMRPALEAAWWRACPGRGRACPASRPARAAGRGPPAAAPPGRRPAACASRRRLPGATPGPAACRPGAAAPAPPPSAAPSRAAGGGRWRAGGPCSSSFSISPKTRSAGSSASGMAAQSAAVSGSTSSSKRAASCTRAQRAQRILAERLPVDRPQARGPAGRPGLRGGPRSRPLKGSSSSAFTVKSRRRAASARVSSGSPATAMPRCPGPAFESRRGRATSTSPSTPARPLTLNTVKASPTAFTVPTVCKAARRRSAGRPKTSRS